MVTFLFSVHTITEAKQYAACRAKQGGARAVDLPARSHFTWRALVYRRHCAWILMQDYY